MLQNAYFLEKIGTDIAENERNLRKICEMLRNVKKNQLDNLVDFEKYSKTRIYLQKLVPIQPKTSNILPKFCQELATTASASLGSAYGLAP